MKHFKKKEISVDGNTAELNAPLEQPKTLTLSNKSIFIAIAIVLVLVIAAIVLAYVLPTGYYDTITDSDGNVKIDPEGEFHFADMTRIAWWKVLLSPFMILDPAQPGALMIWAILALLFVIGAVFTALDKTGIMVYMVETLRNKFENKKYVLLFLMPLIFMFLSSTAGMFEELIPIAPVVILLSYAFGWDALVGLGMSILAACFGFSAGVVNPFNVGVSQSLLGLPIFSEIPLRLLTFVCGYIILMLFLFPYAKRIEKHPEKSLVYKEDRIRRAEFDFENKSFVKDPQKDKALKWFGGWLLVIVFVAIISIFIQPTYIPSLGKFSLADYVLYITVAIYIIAGLGACLMCGLKGKALLKCLGKGLLTLAPAVGMILIAGGVRYIIQEGNVMDTILYGIIGLCEGQNPAVIILLIYAAIFVFEIFIPSGSAKAFLLIPLIGALCTKVGINTQIAVLSLAFADGFSNVILPTNAGLLLLLGMTTVNYPKWIRWSGKIQLVMFAATVGILMLAHFVVFA